MVVKYVNMVTLLGVMTSEKEQALIESLDLNSDAPIEIWRSLLGGKLSQDRYIGTV